MSFITHKRRPKMARHLATNIQIDDFIEKVIEAAECHAHSVAHVIEPLSQAVRGRLNLAVDRVEVYERNGKLARTCWVTLGGQRWVFSYVYGAGVIELRRGSTQGGVVFQFDNHTPAAALQQQVSAL
jgi:hypothetical protein